MIHQLRIYEIFEPNRDAFHARFRNHAARLMKKHGFRIVDMWESRGDRRLEFVYVLEWPDEAARGQAADIRPARQSGRRHRGPDTASEGYSPAARASLSLAPPSFKKT